MHTTLLRIFLLILLARPLLAAERVALVITNYAYPGDPDRLPRPGEKLLLKRLDGVKLDGPLVESALKSVGFTVEIASNLTTAQLKTTVQEFARKHTGTREVLFYFSGHGIGVDGESYLAGLDTNVDLSTASRDAEAAGRKADFDTLKRNAVKAEQGGAVPLSLVLANLEKMTPDGLSRDDAKTHVRIVFIDACRDPFPDPEAGEIAPKSAFALTKSGGLGAPPPKPGMFIGFGAQAGRVSFSLKDQPSLFTAALAERIRKPGQVVDAFRDIREAVADRVEKLIKAQPALEGYEQVPAYADELNPRVGFAFVSSARPKTRTEAEKIRAATKESPYTNFLGMKFVPIDIVGGSTDGRRVFFSVWETRVRDYEAFRKEENRPHEQPEFVQTQEHPIVNVSEEDARAFCVWLSGKSGLQVRLPTDHEWSCAAGLREDGTASSRDKSMKSANEAFKRGGLSYPWGGEFPPPNDAGNYASKVGLNDETRNDGFEFTAPVGKFAPTRSGLFDLSGNVWEMCVSESDEGKVKARGAGWETKSPGLMTFDYRHDYHDKPFVGFRCVIVP